MNKLVVTLVLALSLTLLAGATISPGQKSPSPQAGALTIGDILEQVYSRLNRLEKTAVPMLDTDTADEISQLMTEIHALLETLPENTRLSSAYRGEDSDVAPEEQLSNEKPGADGSKLKPRLTPVPDRYPISDDDFYLLTVLLKQEPLRKNRLELIKSSAETERYTAEQVVTILTDCLVFNSDRLEALKYISPDLVDPENKVSILQSFMSYEAQERAEEIMREN